MKKLMSILVLTGFAMLLTATPMLQTFLSSAAVGIAAAQNEPDGDNNGEASTNPTGTTTTASFRRTTIEHTGPRGRPGARQDQCVPWS